MFFDEAHSLANEAADSLLKDVEEAKPGVIFCFATTEFARIRPALRSRLSPLEVHPLSASDAVGLLKYVADKEGIEYEPSALELLARLKQGYPRDILKGLGQVFEPGSGLLTTKQVRKAFDVDHTQVLVAYFLALADGDSARQTQLMYRLARAAGREGQVGLRVPAGALLQRPTRQASCRGRINSLDPAGASRDPGSLPKAVGRCEPQRSRVPLAKDAGILGG